MSEGEFDAAIPAVLQEYRKTDQRMREASAELNGIASDLLALGAALRINPKHEFTNPSGVHEALHSLSSDFSANKLRTLVYEFTTLRARLAGLESDLKIAGISHSN